MKQKPSIESQVCKDIKQRQSKGIKKYGVTVANNSLNLKQWLQHAYEECLDQAIYLKRAMREVAEPALSMECSTPNCRNTATLQLLGEHPICRKCGDEKNRKSRIRSAQHRSEGHYSPSIKKRWSAAKRKRMRELQ